MTKKLPVLISKEIYIYPSFSSEINVGRERSVNTVKISKEKFKNQVLMISEINTEEPVTLKNIYKVGVLCEIDIVRKLSKGFLINLTSIKRIKIKKFDELDGILYGTYQTLKDKKMTSDETVKLNDLIFNFMELIGKKIPKKARNKLNNNKNITEFLYTILQNYPENKEHFKQKALEAENLFERYKIISKYVKFEPLKNINFSKIIDQNINKRINDRLSNQQREFILREKMKAIREELGEIDPKSKDVKNYLDRLEKEPFPEYIKVKLKNEIQRLQVLPPNSGETSLLKNYIDWVINIPWYQRTDEVVDLKKAKKILDDSHFGLKSAKERIIEHLASNIFSKSFTGQIICLAGPPGVGKTSLGSSIAKAMNKEYVRISLGGVKDEAEIRGHRRTYIGAMPGKIIQSLKKAKTINPVILIDEIDKLSSDFRGDPASAMLEVLDPEQNKTFVDHYIEEPYDLSKVMFIATANSLWDIPPALFDRMEIINLFSYTEIEKLTIAQKYMLPKILNKLGLNDKQVNFTTDGLKSIIKYYTRESGVRELDRIITKIGRKIIVKLLEKKKIPEKITETIVEKLLGKKIYEFTQKNNKSEIGVVTGLAYTQFGGDILPIETTMFEGSGKLILTGKLGEVMQESANISFDFIKANHKTFAIDFKLFNKKDFHIHVPEGAIPKDGPSAGVTITSALISLLKNEKVSNDIAMTGEITLRGKVLPIGGLREKSISAVRSGIKKIFIPKENKKDYEKLPKEIKESLEVVMVDKYQQIFDYLFEKKITTKTKTPKNKPKLKVRLANPKVNEEKLAK